MAYIKDLAGHTYGKLRVIRYDSKNRHGASLWLCECECGTRKVVNSNDLRRPNGTKSCGCHRAAELKKGRESTRTHGKTGTSEHHIWLNIIYRCHSETSRQYPHYGGRGIRVCKRWRESFEAFAEDMGPRPSMQHTIDRIDNNKGYEPGNCRWATMKQQGRNRRNNRVLTYLGKTKTMQEWADITGLDKATIHGRLRRGWSIEKALRTPSDRRYATCKAK